MITCVSETVTRGEEVKKSENFVDVINGSPLTSQKFDPCRIGSAPLALP